MRIVKPGDPPIKLADWVPEAERLRVTAWFQDREAGIPLSPSESGDQDSIARSLEFQDYEDYLRSPLWRKIRRRVLRRDNNACRRCEGAADRVHHRKYTKAVLEGSDDDYLVSVCEGCHESIHRDESGKYRSAADSERILVEGHRETDYPRPKVDLRRKKPKHPPEWSRMTAAQRVAWS